MQSILSAAQMNEIAIEEKIPGYVTEYRFGHVVCTLATSDRVSTVDLQSTRDTVRRIVSECMYAGMECTLPQALAAAYSVVDGAPIAMAVDNVGPLPSAAVIERHEAFLAIERANTRAYLRAR